MEERRQTMLKEVITCLSKSQKTLPSKYFYDNRGSELFEKICQLDEYYLTRTELSIMRNNINEICHAMGGNIRLVELGSGSSLKTRLILDHLKNIHSYIPVDISEEFLTDIVGDLRREYPSLKIVPIAADYTQSFGLPEDIGNGIRRIAYYPGSTIGNFTKKNAENFIESISQLVGKQGGLLIGFDLIKDRTTLINAYDDSQGVTAEFNKNILRRINRELDANFIIENYDHKALFNEDKGRIEMYLVSETDQKVNIAEKEFFIEAGEPIHTENSHKYSLESFREMTEPYFKHVTTWTDPQNMFCVQFLTNSSIRNIG